jgi:hypothetical protein
MRKPHVPQKRKLGGTSLPHDGQRRICTPADAGANPGEKPGTPGGGPIGVGIGCIGACIGGGIGCCIGGAMPGIPALAPSGPGGGIPGIPGAGRIPGAGIGWRCIGCPIGEPGAGSAIIVFIIATSPLGLGAAVSSAPHPRQNL